MRLNIEKLKRDLKKTEEHLRRIKGIFRESGQPRLTWRVYQELAEMKHVATVLCSLRAHSRGKIHLRSKSLQEQAKLINGWLDDYRIDAGEQAA